MEYPGRRVRVVKNVLLGDGATPERNLFRDVREQCGGGFQRKRG